MSVLKKNITYNLLGQIIVIPLSFISFKYIYSDLGDDALGLIYFSLMLGTIFCAALDMGLSKTTVREIAAHHSDEPAYIKKLIQTFSSFYWLAFILLTGLFVYFLPVIVHSWIKLTAMETKLASYVLLILGISSLLAIPKMLFMSVCFGLQRMDITNAVEVLLMVIQQAGVILLLMNGNDIIAVAYWMAVINIMSILVYMVFISRLLSINVMLPLFSMEVVNRVKQYTSKMAMVSLLLLVHKQLDKVLLSKFLPIGLLGIYSFSFSVVGKTALVTGAVAQAVFPSFSEMEKHGEKKELFDKFTTLQDLLIFGTVPLFAFVVFATLPLFTFLLDADKAQMLQLPILFLCISFYFNAALRMLSTYVSATGKPEYIVNVNTFLLIVVTPISVLLIFTFGILGAAISWVLYYILSAIYMVPKVYKNELHQSPYLWFKTVMVAVALICLAYIPFWHIASTYFSEDVVSLLLLYVFGTIIYCIVALNCIGNGLRKVILSYVPAVQVVMIARAKGG